MNKLIVKGNKNGTLLRDERYGTLWELVAPPSSDCKTFGFAFVEIDAGKESPAHYHRQTEELYYVVSGSGVATVNGEEIAVASGDTVIIPRGVVHKIRALPAGLTFVCLTVPPYDPEDDIEV